MEWEVYRGLLEADQEDNEVEEVQEYGALVGQTVAARMLLFRGNETRWALAICVRLGFD